MLINKKIFTLFKNFYHKIDNWSIVSRNLYHLDLIDYFPECPWDYSDLGLSSNPCLTTEFIENHMEKPWDWHCLVKNTCLDIKFIDFHYEFLEEFIDWGNLGLSNNPSVTLDFIEKHIDKPWSWGKYRFSYKLPVLFIEKNYSHIEKYLDWGVYGLSSNKTLTLDFIEKHIDKPWAWGLYGISSNPNLTPEFVNKYSHKKWNWYQVYKNKNTKSYVKDNYGLITSLYPNVDVFMDKFTNKSSFETTPPSPWFSLMNFDILEKYSSDNLNFGKSGLSSNSHVNLDFIKQNLNQKWDWSCLSLNIKLDCSFVNLIENTPQFDDIIWDSMGLSRNLTLNPDFIRKYKNKPWNWNIVLSNNFDYYIKRENAAQIIQKGCHDWLWKPVLLDGKPGIVPRLGSRALNLDKLYYNPDFKLEPRDINYL